jgi:hypothetical protein
MNRWKKGLLSVVWCGLVCVGVMGTEWGCSAVLPGDGLLADANPQEGSTIEPAPPTRESTPEHTIPERLLDSRKAPDVRDESRIGQERIPDTRMPDNMPSDAQFPESSMPFASCDLSGLSSEPYQPGVSYFGRNRYIKYIAGNLPIILSAPHGGSLKPSEIKSRTTGVLGGDTYSREYTYEVARRLYQLTGRWPHIIVNRLHRSKLDANREIVEASQGDTNSETAWGEFRKYILVAREWASKRCQKGHYFDLHTNAHQENWLELGYLLYSSELKQSNQTLDTVAKYRDKSSIKTLALRPTHLLSALLRGPDSLGALMQVRGYKTVPSPTHPHPNGGGYFSGGYNTASYGSRGGGTIDGTQIETHLSMIQNDKRYNYSRALADAMVTFVERWYGFRIRKPVQTVPHSACNNARRLAWNQGKIEITDHTWRALAQYPGKLHCGTNSKLNGPQVYYQFLVTAGKQYEIRVKPDFPSRVYLFAGSCSADAINANCKASGVNGVLALTDEEKSIVYKPSKSGDVRLAIGSLHLHWLGRFRLRITER